MTGNGDLDPVGKHNKVLAWRSRARTGVACAKATAVAQAGSTGEAAQSKDKKQKLKAEGLEWLIYEVQINCLHLDLHTAQKAG